MIGGRQAAARWRRRRSSARWLLTGTQLAALPSSAVVVASAKQRSRRFVPCFLGLTVSLGPLLDVDSMPSCMCVVVEESMYKTYRFTTFGAHLAVFLYAHASQ
mmetsp:Transcript_54262/g.164878  ORF Transcript_54262/g.164878 Transcript_54262/m.164878 type:complete len:103 (-) Transcript_54262:23-331(-)